MTVFETTVRTLTPVHIGDGDELRRDFDFAVHGHRTYRLNENTILQAKEGQWLDTQGNYKPPAQLLGAGDFERQEFFRYSLPGIPRSVKVDARLRSQIKDIHDCPYVPGSTLKGALRTALAWTGWPEVRPQLDRAAIGRSRSWAGQPLERKLFGPDPNHDLLRALHTSDLLGPKAPGEGLMLINAQVLTKKSADGSPIELEAIKSEKTFTGTLTIDETLFSPMAERELHFGNRRHWLVELMARAQTHSQTRIAKLAEWYEIAEGCEAIANFYRQLEAAKVPNNSALMQIGWGVGWDGKTFGTHLQSDPRLFEQLIADFRLHKAGPKSPQRVPGAAFPRSKRAAMSVREGAAKPAAPLGWVLVELKEKGD